MAANDFVIAITTCASEAEALHLSHTIVEARLGACVQVVQVTSVYEWQGSVEQAAEWRLEIKTASECVGRLKTLIAEKHSYDTPELVVTPVIDGSEGYLHWVTNQAD